jgi:hypothetical protein
MASGSIDSDHTEAMWRERGPGAARRLKTYSAELGYVWEYFFAGHEKAAYRFEVSATRGAFSTVAIEIDPQALETAARREVRDVEEYGVAKVALLRTFDRFAPSELPHTVRPGLDELRGILQSLDLL